MTLNKTQRQFIVRSFILSPVLINLVANSFLGWRSFGGRDAVSAYGTDGFALDSVLTSFLIAFLTCLVVVPIVWQSIRQGDQAIVNWRRQEIWWMRWLPNNKWARAFMVAVVAAVLFAAIAYGLLPAVGVTSLSGSGAIAFKSVVAVTVAATVTPFLALASWADVSGARLAESDAATKAIPFATLPSNGDATHIKAMQSDMIGYVEHIGQEDRLLRIPLFGPVNAYFVNDPDLIREVLVKQAKHFHKPSNVKRAANSMQIENLFTTDGELWQALRRTMQPAFHARRIEKYMSIMVNDTRTMIDSWQNGMTIDTPAEMMELTLATTTQALFGKDMRNADAADAIIRFIELFYARISGVPVPGWLPTQANREMKQQLAIIEQWLQPMIAERKTSEEPFDDVLSMLIEAQKVDSTGLLTDKQVQTEIMNLFVAGYEVVAHTLAFTLYLVAEHPEVEQKIHEELNNVLAGGPMSLAALGELNYLDMVLKESMRLLPVTTVLTRQTAAAVELGGYSLPKNRLILFAPWVLQRDPAYWDDPLEFRPNRFDPTAEHLIPKYAYLPFSAGPRVCIGNTFAMMQMKINLAMIWQAWHLSTPPNYEFEPIYSFNTRSKDGLPLIATPAIHQAN